MLLLLILAISTSAYVVKPGFRGVVVTLGRVSSDFRSEGFHLKLPLISKVAPQLVQQQAVELEAECYSSDLQQVEMSLKVLYRVPENAVVRLYRDFEGGVFESLVRPRVAEALKEVTAVHRAEQIVQQREAVKAATLASAREKVGGLVAIEDVVLEDIRLTGGLESAIESKMVQEQEANRAKFAQQQVETEARTLVIHATGEAEAIELQGKALRENPSVLDLQIVARWDGVPPQVVGPGISGAELILPLGAVRPTETDGGAQ